MHLTVFASYWWLVLVIMAMVVLGFVLVAGRGANGGLGGRARLGWEKWRGLSRRTGEVQARIILTLFYFTFGAPFGLVRTFLADSLRIRPRPEGPIWWARTTRDRTLENARRQY